MFKKLLSYALIVIGLISMGDVSAKTPEELKSVKRVLRAPLRNESGEKTIQSKRRIQKRSLQIKRGPQPKAAPRVGVRPRISAQRNALPPAKAPLIKRGAYVRPGKTQDQTVRRGQENKKITQINQKNRPNLPLKPSPTVSPRKPGQAGTVKVSDLSPAERTRIQKTLGALSEKGIVTYRYPARIGGIPLIENIEYTGPASKKGYDKRQFSSYGDAMSSGSVYSSKIYSHKRSSHTKVRLGRQR